MKAKVTADLLNVRAQPSLQGSVIGLLTMNQDVEVLSLNEGWAALALKAGGADLTLGNQLAAGFASAQFLDIEGRSDDDGNKDVRPFRLGLHTMSNTHLARQEAERGCRYFMVMNDFGGAANLKRAFPDAVVMVRRFIEHHGLITVDQMMQGLEGAEHKDLIYTGINENDQVSDKGQGLLDRAQFDVAVARRIKERSGATYAAGTFSVGCPDFTDPDVCRVIREIYAPAYNSGLLAFDMHLYSPNPQNIDKPGEWRWFERRWEFLFTRCGFDPKIRAIYCGECGLDEMGVGGFPAHNTSTAQFADWCRKYIAAQSEPMVVDGVKYPSPVQGGAIFQLGGNGDPRWEGYNVQGYLPTLREFYTGKPQGVVTRGVRPATVEDGKPKGLTARSSRTRNTTENKAAAKPKSKKKDAQKKPPTKRTK